MKMSIGFDISKLTVDVAFFDGKTMEHLQVENSKGGFTQIFNKSKQYAREEILFTMEATGVYHQRCAEFFNAKGRRVSVINPLIMRRYAQMKMLRAKTDKVDSQMIAQYGWNEEPLLYKTLSENRRKIRGFLKAIENLKETRTQNTNRMEALSQHSCDMEEVRNVFLDLNKKINEQVKHIENRIYALVQNENAEEYEYLLSIPGVGKRLASAIIGYFGSLEDFETSKQMIGFIGANPSPWMSGSSVKGKGCISRKGNGYLRRLFYLAALSAYKYNTSCKDLYDRLTAKGKAKKVALIAVANKLTRQVFAVVKYKRRYDPIFAIQPKN